MSAPFWEKTFWKPTIYQYIEEARLLAVLGSLISFIYQFCQFHGPSVRVPTKSKHVRSPRLGIILEPAASVRVVRFASGNPSDQIQGEASIPDPTSVGLEDMSRARPPKPPPPPQLIGRYGSPMERLGYRVVFMWLQ